MPPEPLAGGELNTPELQNQKLNMRFPPKTPIVLRVLSMRLTLTTGPAVQPEAGIKPRKAQKVSSNGRFRVRAVGLGLQDKSELAAKKNFRLGKGKWETRLEDKTNHNQSGQWPGQKGKQ
jgi:hypothetical protein